LLHQDLYKPARVLDVSSWHAVTLIGTYAVHLLDPIKWMEALPKAHYDQNEQDGWVHNLFTRRAWGDIECFGRLLEHEDTRRRMRRGYVW
jgi:hypothetical protein